MSRKVRARIAFAPVRSDDEISPRSTPPVWVVMVRVLDVDSNITLSMGAWDVEAISWQSAEATAIKHEAKFWSGGVKFQVSKTFGPYRPLKDYQPQSYEDKVRGRRRGYNPKPVDTDFETD